MTNNGQTPGGNTTTAGAVEHEDYCFLSGGDDGRLPCICALPKPTTTPATQELLPVTQFLPIETMQLWDVGVVTDWTNAAVSQKAEADDGEHYFAIDPEDGLEWEPTHWAPFPNSQAHSLPGDVGGWIVGNSDGTKWRVWDALGPKWTTDRDRATQYARRVDAEQVHAKDEGAWRVEPFAALTPSALSGDAGEKE